MLFKTFFNVDAMTQMTKPRDTDNASGDWEK